MFDCVTLEYKICEMFRKSDNNCARGLWCDGVMLSESEQHYSKKSVKNNGYVYLNAWIGETKNARLESLYVLRLNFGSGAMDRYARDLNIDDCLINVCTLDIAKKIIEIQLK